jgi:hypothetical protein
MAGLENRVAGVAVQVAVIRPVHFFVSIPSPKTISLSPTTTIRKQKESKKNVMHRPGIEPGASRIYLKQMATANFTTKPPMRE